MALIVMNSICLVHTSEYLSIYGKYVLVLKLILPTLPVRGGSAVRGRRMAVLFSSNQVEKLPCSRAILTPVRRFCVHVLCSDNDCNI